MGNRFTMAERERLEVIKNHIQAHLDDGLYLTELCHMALMNRHRLNVGFKKLYGRQVSVYIKEQRMLQARELLQQTDLPTREIAASCGYCYPNNFLRAYKAFFGHTPARERKETD